MSTPDPPRLFADVIAETDKGRTHDELTEALATVAAAVVETGKKGRLVLTLDLVPLKGTSGALSMTAAVKATVPAVDRNASLFFAGPTGRLTRDDPNQPTFEGLREVGATPSAKTKEHTA